MFLLCNNHITTAIDYAILVSADEATTDDVFSNSECSAAGSIEINP